MTLINNDASRNRMSLDFMDALEAQVDALDRDDSVGAVVIRGAGDDHFSVGINLKQMPGHLEQGQIRSGL
ncbi:MAG: enoyl-CoA hydratase/isomerase family protein [Pseudomonadota bacterium]